jgi:hypothetical protein
MTPAKDIDTFCRAVGARSQEHRQAMQVAVDQGWWAITGSVLRMELDSMIRVIYLLRRPASRDRILASCVAGQGFRDGGRRIPDSDMLAVAIGHEPWVKSVYEFGNKFVHLTDAHDYAEVDPFRNYKDKDQVIDYLRQYQGQTIPGLPLDGGSTMREIAAYAPDVLNKISSNLGSYIDNLRAAIDQCS